MLTGTGAVPEPVGLSDEFTAVAGNRTITRARSLADAVDRTLDATPHVPEQDHEQAPGRRP